MVMVYLHGKVETFTKETIETMKEMALERCIGLTGLSTKVNGKRESNMDKEK
jgi:hypothetical protein